MISVCKEFRFSAGHRVCGHEGRCAHLHGHNYLVRIHLACADDALDSLGMVTDFYNLKHVMGRFFDVWDHRMLLWRNDPVAKHLIAFRANHDHGLHDHDVDDAVWTALALVLLPCNPTAEEIAKHLLYDVVPDKLSQILSERVSAVKVTRVEVWETDTCFAVAEVE